MVSSQNACNKAYRFNRFYQGNQFNNMVRYILVTLYNHGSQTALVAAENTHSSDIDAYIGQCAGN
ncbi:hypothetical protein EVA_09524 [gut metagenome]|uniref:Uncharacterized protein n=1 Tax=gut metagenome TaxID=749906 RepID=J9CQF7_9ZZZZ